MGDKLLTPKEVCEHLSISQNTLYRLLDEGKIAGCKVGQQWRFFPADVEAYLRKCRVSARAQISAVPSMPRRGRPPKVAGCGYVPGMKVV